MIIHCSFCKCQTLHCHVEHIVSITFPSTFNQTQHFIYSVPAQQHVLAQQAIIRFARMEDKIQFIMEIEISVS